MDLASLTQLQVAPRLLAFAIKEDRPRNKSFFAYRVDRVIAALKATREFILGTRRVVFYPAYFRISTTNYF